MLELFRRLDFEQRELKQPRMRLKVRREAPPGETGWATQGLRPSAKRSLSPGHASELERARVARPVAL